MPARASVEPITDGDLCSVAEYLSTNMKSGTRAEKWERSLRAPWRSGMTNYGYMLRAEGRIVGVFCAFYSEQQIKGRQENFCNPHSWNVTEAYRSQSMDLLLALLRQKNFNFTMYTPNPTVTQVFEAMKFRHMDTSLIMIPHFPWPATLSPGCTILTDTTDIIEALPTDAAARLADHLSLDWLRHIAVRGDGRTCNIIYKVGHWKRLRLANILYISHVPIYLKYRKQLGSRLLLKNGIAMSRVENRFLKNAPLLSFTLRGTMPKMFLSDHLAESDMSNLYSELLALDL